MIVKMNVVVHCKEANHDKIYMGCIRQQSNGSFVVIGKWGRVGKKFSSQVKGTANHVHGAAIIRDNVIQEKIAKGYQDVLSPDYHEGVTFTTPCVAENLEPQDVRLVQTGKASEPVVESQKSATKNRGKEYPVICVNNTGIEDRFDANIEYLAENHSDPKMIWVIDKFGKKDEFLRDRFDNEGK